MKLNGNKKKMAGIIRQGPTVALLPRSFLSLRLFSCFLFFAEPPAAAAFYSVNDYAVFLERDVSHLQNRLTDVTLN